MNSIASLVNKRGWNTKRNREERKKKNVFSRRRQIKEADEMKLLFELLNSSFDFEQFSFLLESFKDTDRGKETKLHVSIFIH